VGTGALMFCIRLKNMIIQCQVTYSRLEHGNCTGSVILDTMAVTGVVFLIKHTCLLFMVFRYKYQYDEKAKSLLSILIITKLEISF